MAVAIAATDPDRAARLRAHAERIAYSLTSESSQVLTLTEIAQALGSWVLNSPR